jgi:hypothetical protein
VVGELLLLLIGPPTPTLVAPPRRGNQQTMAEERWHRSSGRTTACATPCWIGTTGVTYTQRTGCSKDEYCRTPTASIGPSYPSPSSSIG